MKKAFSITINVILSLLTTMSFCYLNSVEISDVLFFFLTFIVLTPFYLFTRYKKDNYSLILSIILSILLILGKYVVYIYESTDFELAFKIIITLIGSFCFFFRFFPFIFDKLTKFNLSNSNINYLKLFFISFFILLICWIPMWIAQYPGSFNPDTLTQLNQAFGNSNYNNMNPLFHTLLLKLAYSFFGLFIKDINTCSFVIEFVIMLLNSAIYSYVIVYITKKTRCLSLAIISIIFYAFISYNVFYNVTITKDGAYAAMLSLFVLFIDKFCTFPSKKNAILLILISIFYSLMRSNGYYSLIVCFIVVLIMSFKINFKKTTIVLLISLTLVTLIRFPLYNVILNALNKTDTQQESGNANNENKYKFRGNFLIVIPFQQVANVVTHGRELNEKETWLIEEYIGLDKIPEVYNPILIDPLFSSIEVNAKDTRKNISNIEYIKLWIELFLKYPGDYIEAYVNMTRYYYYPNRYVITYVTGVYDNNLGLARNYLISKNYTDFIENLYDKQKDLPIISTIFTPGTTTFILFAAIFYSLREKRYVSFVSLFPLLVNVLILMAFVPLNDEFRYIYPVVASLPFITSSFFAIEKRLLISEGGEKC